jgi:hypothetical protein
MKLWSLALYREERNPIFSSPFLLWDYFCRIVADPNEPELEVLVSTSRQLSLMCLEYPSLSEMQASPRYILVHLSIRKIAKLY